MPLLQGPASLRLSDSRLGGARAPPSPTPKKIAKRAAEQIPKSIKDVFDVLKAAAAAAGNARVSELVVTCTFLGVAQNLIRFGSFLETLSRLGIVGIAVGVIPNRQPPIGRSDVAFGCIPIDSKDFVVVAFAQPWSA